MKNDQPLTTHQSPSSGIRAVPVPPLREIARVVHSGRSTCHAISGPSSLLSPPSTFLSLRTRLTPHCDRFPVRELETLHPQPSTLVNLCSSAISRENFGVLTTVSEKVDLHLKAQHLRSIKTRIDENCSALSETSASSHFGVLVPDFCFQISSF